LFRASLRCFAQGRRFADMMPWKKRRLPLPRARCLG